jgi:hypothetical protein
MLGRVNQKILGAVVLGFALVAGAYTITTFGQPRTQQPAAVGSITAPARVAVNISDNDQNGIEDWRDEFATAKAVVINQASTTYVAPTTVTGLLGIHFMEDVIRAKNSGPFARSQDEVVSDTVENLVLQTNQELYDTKDISIMDTWTDADIKNYANAMATAIINNDVKNVENELVILNDALNRGNHERINELQIIVDIYLRTIEDSIATPVPAIFVKQHLDLINSYRSVGGDVEGMMLSSKDPAVALIRIKRYEDDTLGLRRALQNMYSAFEPYASLFTSVDAASYFSNHNPKNQFN